MSSLASADHLSTKGLPDLKRRGYGGQDDID